MEQFMKKSSIFFAAAQYCGRKKVMLTQGPSFHFFSYLCKFLRSNLFVFFFFFAIFFSNGLKYFFKPVKKILKFQIVGFVCLFAKY